MKGVVQRYGPIPAPLTFYATFDVSSLCSYIPHDTAVLLPASSWQRTGLKKPVLPASVTQRGADSGGFVASRIWGEYRYTLAQYVGWLTSWQPQWAATMDYCCERELSLVTRERQEKTTQNAWQAWRAYRSASWAWVPTVQGFAPDEYRRHAHELAPLLCEMQAQYRDNPHWRVGIGTLCRRDDVVMVQRIVDAVRAVLPGIPLHLWGIKLDALRSIDLAQVISTDSAVWHGAMYARDALARAARERGMSMRAYQVMVNLPAYRAKVADAVRESAHVMETQRDASILAQARAVLSVGGWTLQIRTRRNRLYTYGARRVGKRVEQRYVCPVSQLEAWLASGRCVA